MGQGDISVANEFPAARGSLCASGCCTIIEQNYFKIRRNENQFLKIDLAAANAWSLFLELI
jgi:hypothetical protein